MNNVFDVTAWLEEQVGRSYTDVMADGKAKAKETRHAVVLSQRGRINMQTRSFVSDVTKADSRMGYFLKFAQKFDKRPPGATTADWDLYQAIVRSWVENGYVRDRVLRLFEK